MFHDVYLRGLDIIVFADCRLLYPMQMSSQSTEKDTPFNPLPLFPLATNLSFAFRSRTSNKNPQKRALKKENKPISYTRARYIKAGIKAKFLH